MGIAGGSPARGSLGNAERGCRLSDQHGDGVLILRALDAEVDELGARLFELRLCLGDIALCTETALEANLRKLQRLRVCVDGGAQQLRLKIEAAQLEVGDGEQTLQAEPRVGEVGGGGLRAGRGGLDLAANGSPEVRLPRDVQRDQETPSSRARRSGPALELFAERRLREAEPPMETVG